MSLDSTDLVARLQAGIQWRAEILTAGGTELMRDYEATKAIMQQAANRIKELEQELSNIAKAKPETWGDEKDQFQAWAQNRARNALGSATDQGMERWAEQIEESCQQMLAALEILSTCTGPLKVTHDDRENRH